MASHLLLWTITLLVLVVAFFGTINGVRYYQYTKTAPDVTTKEVYWMAPQIFDPTLCAYKYPAGWSPSHPSPTSGSGYTNYSTAFGTGILASYYEIKDAMTRGMTVNRWGFFDGQCGSPIPSDNNVRGKYCAINCCGPNTTLCGTTAATKAAKVAKKDSPNCSSPSAIPPSSPSSPSSYCCTGSTPKSPFGTTCKACFSPDSGLGSMLGSCTAWYAEKDGVFVACPQANKGASPTPQLPGGPWDASGNPVSGGANQPAVTAGSPNAIQINKHQTLGFGKASAPSPFAQTSGMSNMKWKFRMGNEPNSPGGSNTSNPWAGAFVVGVKPPKGSTQAQGILPFDVTGTAPNSNEGWNDPLAVQNARPASFSWIPTSQIILFLLTIGAILFVVGVMWFKNTRLGESLLYWI